MLAIGPNATIPLHDHPGAFGTHLVLSGSSLHHQFSVLGQHQGAWVLRREQLADKLLLENSMVSYSIDRANVHTFLAGEEGCTLISIARYSAQPSYWYYPTNPIAGQTVIAVRMRRK